MTDIAERLRKFCKWPEPGDGIPNDPVFANAPDLKEAADEIERLRMVLRLIATTDLVDLLLDPEWPQRIARAALAVKEPGHE